MCLGTIRWPSAYSVQVQVDVVTHIKPPPVLVDLCVLLTIMSNKAVIMSITVAVPVSSPGLNYCSSWVFKGWGG